MSSALTPMSVKRRFEIISLSCSCVGKPEMGLETFWNGNKTSPLNTKVPVAIGLIDPRVANFEALVCFFGTIVLLPLDVFNEGRIVVDDDDLELFCSCC